MQAQRKGEERQRKVEEEEIRNDEREEERNDGDQEKGEKEKERGEREERGDEEKKKRKKGERGEARKSLEEKERESKAKKQREEEKLEKFTLLKQSRIYISDLRKELRKQKYGGGGGRGRGKWDRRAALPGKHSQRGTSFASHPRKCHQASHFPTYYTHYYLRERRELKRGIRNLVAIAAQGLRRVLLCACFSFCRGGGGWRGGSWRRCGGGRRLIYFIIE